MKKKAFVFLAEGFEEIEAVTSIDLLRRAEVETITVSVSSERVVVGAHGVPYIADVTINQIEGQKADALVLPGGLPGADNLYASTTLQTMLKEQNQENKLIAAICASPAVVLGIMNLLNGRKATCYPSFEPKMLGATPILQHVVRDGHIITGQGPAASIAFALEIVEALTDATTRQAVATGLLYNE